MGAGTKPYGGLSGWAGAALRSTARGAGHAAWRVAHGLALLGPSIAASLGAQVATWGQSLHHFSVASWTGLAVNLVAIPLAGLTVPALLLAGIVALHPAADGSLHVIVLARSLAEVLLGGIGWASRVGEMLVGRISETGAVVGSSGALVALWACVRVSESKRRVWRGRATRGRMVLLFAGIAVISGFVVPTLAARRAHDAAKGFRATFLDVGQGDAVLIEIGGMRWLYDTGPPPARGLVRALLEAGVDRLDRVFLTHGDQDHWGGLGALLASPIRVDTLSISAAGAWPETFWEALESAVPHAGRAPGAGSPFPPRSHPVLERVGAGWERAWPGARCRVLHPGPGFTSDGRNDYSIVLWIEDGSDSASPGTGRLLLIGDIESPAQKALLADGGAQVVDVAQAGHHGSATSVADGWYDRIAPRLVVASLAADNRYGFPHPKLLTALSERGIPLRRTDELGAIGVAWDGYRWRVRSGGTAPWSHP